ncbi:MAG: 3-phosphoserine/phosphohydroxythreonine transaminase [Phycisphaerales bacterium]|nr:MAG: 3-phosphoserine/phosphohydroxythreonine transaminase [Phycisphaerales bacterium]
MSERVFNFSAGPGCLPESVLKQAQRDLWDIDGSGVGILEHSHRGKVVDKVFDEAQADCRALAGIPENYKVMFLTGGASAQFYMLPMSFLKKDQTADYINTGVWSTKAIKDAKRYGGAHVAASSEDRNFCYIPKADAIRWSGSPRYAHFTSNNTIFGTQWRAEPRAPEGVPLICDASSDIFSKPIDVTKYALIYAGAQKNLGPAGATLVIAREDFIEQGSEDIPELLQYRTYAANDSRANTPPVFAVYMVGLVFKWILEQGGLDAMRAHNEAKAKPLYDYLDGSSFFNATADADSRSLMNVCFRAPSEELEKAFIAEATKAGFDGLKGHRSVGGMRASIYNAFPPEGVVRLVEFMEKFEKRHG